MTTVTTSAARYGTAEVLHHARAARREPTAELALLVVAALVPAVLLPADVVVFGVLLVGVAHIVLEVRYVVGRHPEVVQGTGVALLQAALVAVLLARLVPFAGLSRTVELATWAVLLLVVLVRRFGEQLRQLLLGAALVAGATALAIGAGDAWFLFLVHAHNLVPAVFLWRWSRRRLAGRDRQLFRLVVVAWSAVIPILLLAGAADSVAGSGSSVADRLFGIDAATATVAPSGWVDATGGHRLLVAFAFAQLVHYAVWIWFLPRHDPEATATFAATPPGRALRGWRLPALLVVGTVAVLLVAALDYRHGRTFYGALGGYHAYLEFPVLIGLLVDSLNLRRRDAFASH